MYSLGQSLGNPTVEVAPLLGVREVLALKDLEFPILLDECEDGDRIVVECGSICCRGNDCNLRRGHAL